MIKILGPRRLFVLLILIGANLALAAALYYQFVPRQLLLERQLRTAKNSVAAVENDIQKIQIEFEQLEQQQEAYDVLKQDGFLSAQGRRQAERLFEKIQMQSKVVTAVASVQAANLDRNEIAGKAEHVVLQSPVTVKIEAIDDIDIYAYISMLVDEFSGHITIDELSMNRKMEITNPVLRGITGGDDLALVSADLKMTWRTMIPEKEAVTIVGKPKKGGRR